MIIVIVSLLAAAVIWAAIVACENSGCPVEQNEGYCHVCARERASKGEEVSRG